jgi:hypothetical protein
MKDEQGQGRLIPLDPKKIWEEVKCAAARAPEWASTDPPYPVKAGYLQTRQSEEADAASSQTNAGSSLAVSSTK